MEAKRLPSDIVNRADIELLLRAFYGQILGDPEIGHFFTQVVSLDLAAHLPRLADFWESILFQSAGYQGDAMAVHLALHHQSPLTAHHFEVWLRQFAATVDNLFVGEKADLAKERARTIASLMQVKIKRAALG
jgi:hemoglobin